MSIRGGVQIVVVMDCCTDDTRLVVGDYPVQGIVGRYRNVGKARAAGAKYALEHGTRWLAFTDADTVVPASWLVKQLGCGTDVVCGTVTVEDWSLNKGKTQDLPSRNLQSYKTSMLSVRSLLLSLPV